MSCGGRRVGAPSPWGHPGTRPRRRCGLHGQWSVSIGGRLVIYQRAHAFRMTCDEPRRESFILSSEESPYLKIPDSERTRSAVQNDRNRRSVPARNPLRTEGHAGAHGEMRVLLSILALASASTTNAAAQCTFTPNCDYGKGSRQYGAATTRDECCTLCSNRPGCAAGVWDGNRCWYKTVAQVKHGCQHNAKVKDSCIPKSVKPGPPPAPPPPPIPPLSCSINGTGGTGPVVAFVGDSITYGSGCSEWKYGFVKAINDSVGSKYDLRDCGVSGLDAVKPSHGEHGHGSYWSSAQHTESLAMKPEVVVVMLGTNDADEWCYAQNSSACPGGTSKHYASDLQNVSRKHWLFSMDCHCALPVFYGSYAGSHRCVLFGCFLERQLTQGYMQLPTVKKTYLMIPPPYQYMIGGWSPMTKCPANPLSEGCGLSAPCVFDCQLGDATRPPSPSHSRPLILSRLLRCQQVQRHWGAGRTRKRACQSMHHQLRPSHHRPPGGPGAAPASASRYAVFFQLPGDCEPDADSRFAP